MKEGFVGLAIQNAELNAKLKKCIVKVFQELQDLKVIESVNKKSEYKKEKLNAMDYFNGTGFY